MTADDLRDDPLVQALAGLTGQPPGRERASRTRARCHRQLSRFHAEGKTAASARELLVRRALEPALIAAAAIIFLVDVLRRALLLFRA